MNPRDNWLWTTPLNLNDLDWIEVVEGNDLNGSCFLNDVQSKTFHASILSYLYLWFLLVDLVEDWCMEDFAVKKFLTSLFYLRPSEPLRNPL